MNRNVKYGLLLVVVVMLALVGCKKGEAPIGGGNGGNSNTPELSKEPDHLIFQEIFYVGNYKGKAGMTKSDCYIKINNPTKETIYLDGLALIEGDFDPASPLNIPADQNFIATHVATSRILRIPGTGKEHPLAPGESVVLANVAVETSEGDKGTIDLTKADFEIYTEGQIEEEYWIDEVKDNPSVPNLEIVYTDYIFGDPMPFTMAQNGGVIALAKLEATTEEINTNYVWKYQYLNSIGGQGHSHVSNGECLKIPNEWVIDAVVLCPNDAKRWDVVNKTLDAGWKGVMSTGDDKKSYALKAIARRHNGKFYEDTNNSTVDFEIKQPSLLKNK